MWPTSGIPPLRAHGGPAAPGEEASGPGVAGEQEGAWASSLEPVRGHLQHRQWLGQWAAGPLSSVS